MGGGKRRVVGLYVKLKKWEEDGDSYCRLSQRSNTCLCIFSDGHDEM